MNIPDQWPFDHFEIDCEIDFEIDSTFASSTMNGAPPRFMSVEQDDHNILIMQQKGLRFRSTCGQHELYRRFWVVKFFTVISKSGNIMKHFGGYLLLS